MIKLTAEEARRIERSMAKFNTCNYSGSTISIEVNKKLETKTFLGYCDNEKKRVDIEPSCRICLRHRSKKKKSTKKTAATISRIKQGKLRRQQKKEERENGKMRRPGLDHF